MLTSQKVNIKVFILGSINLIFAHSVSSFEIMELPPNA